MQEVRLKKWQIIEVYSNSIPIYFFISSVFFAGIAADNSFRGWRRLVYLG
jgi:hypothetical protein